MLRRPLPPLRPPGAKTSGAERRRHDRRPPLEGVTCEVLHGDGRADAAVVNLSEGGACVESPLPLTIDDRLTLLLSNRSCLGSLAAEARVAWCEAAGAAFRVGCQFLSTVATADLLPFLS
jgi:hypothetical protein